MEDDFIIFWMGIFVGFLIGLLVIGLFRFNVEVQKVKEVENGYYITINDEIYEYEVRDER